MAFDPRRSGFIEAVRFATIVLSFGMVGYILFFHLIDLEPRGHADAPMTEDSAL